MEVFDERGHGLVVRGDAPACIVEDVAVDGVAIPVVGAVFGDAFGGVGLFPDHGDESATGLNEASRHQSALAERVHAVAFPNGGRFFREVESFSDLLAGEHGHGPLRELVHRAHETASVEVAADRVHSFQEGHSVVEAGGHVAANAEIVYLELWGAGIATDDKRRGTGPEVGGADGKDVDSGASAIGAEDADRHSISRFAAQDAVNDGRDGGGVIDGAGGGGGNASGHEAFVPTAVIGEVVMDRADDIKLVGYFRLQGHEFTDFDAGDVGGDGFEDAPVFGWGIGFHVIHLHVRWTSGEPDKDDGGVGFQERFCGGRFGGLDAEDIGEGEAEHRQGSELQEGSARNGSGAKV